MQKTTLYIAMLLGSTSIYGMDSDTENFSDRNVPAHQELFLGALEGLEASDKGEESPRQSTNDIFNFDPTWKILEELEDARNVDFDVHGNVKYDLSGRDLFHPGFITNYELASIANTVQFLKNHPDYKVPDEEKVNTKRQVRNEIIKELNSLFALSTKLVAYAQVQGLAQKEMIEYTNNATKNILLEFLPFYSQLMKIVLGYHVPEASYVLLPMITMKDDMYQAIFAHNQVSADDQKHFDAFKSSMLALKEDARKFDLAKKFAAQSATVNNSSTTQS